MGRKPWEATNVLHPLVNLQRWPTSRGHPALAAEDAVGADLVILTPTLGLTALVTRLPVSRAAVEYALAAVLGAVAWVWLRERVS